MKASPYPPPAIRILRVATRVRGSEFDSATPGIKPPNDRRPLPSATEPNAEETTKSLLFMVRPHVDRNIDRRGVCATPGRSATYTRSGLGHGTRGWCIRLVGHRHGTAELPLTVLPLLLRHLDHRLEHRHELPLGG